MIYYELYINNGFENTTNVILILALNTKHATDGPSNFTICVQEIAKHTDFDLLDTKLVYLWFMGLPS